MKDDPEKIAQTESALAAGEGTNVLVLKVVGRDSGRSAVFMKMKDVYPECEFLIRDAPQLFPFRCLKDDFCPRNANCMGKLQKRVQYVFDHFDDADLLLLYFRYDDMPGSHRAGVFSRDLEDQRFPRYVVFNRSMWERMKQIGIVYQWKLPDSLFLTTVGT